MRAKVYTMLTLVVLFVQVFVLNNLSISPLVAPMVYIILILLMPIESSQWKMLSVGLLLGILMDITMGPPGLNTMVTLPIAFFRMGPLHSAQFPHIVNFHKSASFYLFVLIIVYHKFAGFAIYIVEIAILFAFIIC